ncbi:MAG: hypothetical protein FWE74_05780 [Oscillospiraceae bacterium]|nr:hypothetical protein [Oscillospiraceae bacterium]
MYDNLNENEKRVYRFLANKPEGSYIQEVCGAFEDMSLSDIQDIIMKFDRSYMLKGTQKSEKGGCSYIFTLKRF